jgi:hypothetical protein
MEEKTVAKSDKASSFNASSFMSTTAIHIIAEVIAICGMGIYFNSKIGKLTKQNQELVERIEELEDTLGKHEEILEKIVGRMNGQKSNTPAPPPKKAQSKVSPRSKPEQEEDDVPTPSPMNLLSDIMSVAAGQFGPQTTVVHVQTQQKKPEPMPSIEELDSELESELKDLKEEKKE